MPVRLNALDRRILSELQRNAGRSLNAIARAVRRSGGGFARRAQRTCSAGFIAKNVW